jgi:hypothetical protein
VGYIEPGVASRCIEGSGFALQDDCWIGLANEAGAKDADAPQGPAQRGVLLHEATCDGTYLNDRNVIIYYSRMFQEYENNYINICH